MRALLVRDVLNEKVIYQDELEIDIDFGVSSTEHSEERQSRHEGDHISNEEIAENIKAAMKKITNSLIYDELDINERVLIYNTFTHLNIVGAPRNMGNQGILFKVITVMRTPEFRNIKNTKVIKLKRRDFQDLKT